MAKENKENTKVKKGAEYSADDIYVLEGLDPVRQRPGMYIGSTGVDGLHHLIFEVVDNAIDEAMAGYCNLIEVFLQKDGSVKCTDNGRGIPVETHKKTGKSALETVMTTLHAGGKFGSGAYKVSGGLHGVGVSVVCALSDRMRSEICRDGFKYSQEYQKGVPKTKLIKEGACRSTGTTQIFTPDPTIFKDTVEFSLKKVLSHLRQQAYLTSGVKIFVKDERKETPFSYTFYFEGGLKSYIKYLMAENEPKHENVFYVKAEKDDILVEVALQYASEFESLEESFANNIYTGEGGTHLTGFRTALTRVINDYARKNSYLKEKDENLTGNDVREGLIAAVSIKIKEPQFEGQTKAKLGNTEAKTAVESVVSEHFTEFLEKNPNDAKGIIESCLLSARARRAAKAARTTVLRKGVLEGLALPGKLADCSFKNPEDSELYIVEGDSAGGCFFGETKIDLLDNRQISFIDLVKEQEEGKKNYCFSIQKDGSIGVGLIKNVWKTKSDAEVIKITIDNDKEIICTKDHKFMLRDGSYKEAQSLLTSDSLMPLRRRVTPKGGRITIDGYDMLFCLKKQQWVFTHLLADGYNLLKEIYSKVNNSVVHHIDYDKLNNSPDNLKRMDKVEHLYFHATVARDNLSKPETLEKIRRAHQTKEYRLKIKAIMNASEMKEMLSKRAKKQWENQAYKEYMGQKFLDFYKNNATYREKNNKFLDEAQKKYWSNPVYLDSSLKLLREVFDSLNVVDKEHYRDLRIARRNKNALKYNTLLNRFFMNDEFKLFEAVENYNHKIKKIEKLHKKVDVYDLEVEGTHNFALSAGVFVHNSSKMARDRRFQAILPLRGKVLNVERARLDKILANNEIKSLVIALGTAISQDFDIEKLRYHRIIIMSDADVDGSHIKTLLLTLFFRYFKEIIEKGYVYIAQPPLYKIQSGKRIEYAFTDGDKNEILADMKTDKTNPNVQRYKGLGEMNADELWDTTMNPQNRILLRVSIDEAKEADRIFDTLMGAEVAPRKKFIQTHAKSVKNLDI